MLNDYEVAKERQAKRKLMLDPEYDRNCNNVGYGGGESGSGAGTSGGGGTDSRADGGDELLQVSGLQSLHRQGQISLE